jgi:hypothetical protein
LIVPVRQVRGVDGQVLVGVEGRPAVVPLLVAREDVVDIDLALEDRVLLADDGQQDRVAVERAIEGDRVARRRRFDGRPQGDRPGRRRRVVVEGIDHEARIWRVAIRRTAAGGERQGERDEPKNSRGALHGGISFSIRWSR